jgi:Kef-type K+ transport system membrane component KefB
VLADSEYRHELETDIEPFKGLLLGLFFISIGAQIDFGLITSEPVMIASIVLATMAGKLLVLYVFGRLFGLDRPARWILAFSLAQIGEFAFVRSPKTVTSSPRTSRACSRRPSRSRWCSRHRSSSCSSA